MLQSFIKLNIFYRSIYDKGTLVTFLYQCQSIHILKKKNTRNYLLFEEQHWVLTGIHDNERTKLVLVTLHYF